MGFLDRVFGRSTPPKADLDALFSLPGAALTLQSALGFTPTGAGSVAFRAAEGGAFATTTAEVEQLLDLGGGPRVQRTSDDYGYTWLLVQHDPQDVAGLVTDLHAVNTTLEGQGFGPLLLCSLVSFTDAAGRRVALVYLYKRGTFYPFAAAPDGQRRDNALELSVRAALGSDLPVEPDVSRWFPVWGAPGL